MWCDGCDVVSSHGNIYPHWEGGLTSLGSTSSLKRGTSLGMYILTQKGEWQWLPENLHPHWEGEGPPWECTSSLTRRELTGYINPHWGRTSLRMYILTVKGRDLTENDEHPHWEGRETSQGCTSSLRRAKDIVYNAYPHWQWGGTSLPTYSLTEKGEKPHWECASSWRRESDLAGNVHPHGEGKVTSLGMHILTWCNIIQKLTNQDRDELDKFLVLCHKGRYITSVYFHND